MTRERKINTKELNLAFGSVQSMLRDLGFRKLDSRFVLKLLTKEMCERRKNFCEFNLNLLNQGF